MKDSGHSSPSSGPRPDQQEEGMARRYPSPRCRPVENLAVSGSSGRRAAVFLAPYSPPSASEHAQVSACPYPVKEGSNLRPDRDGGRPLVKDARRKPLTSGTAPLSRTKTALDPSPLESGKRTYSEHKQSLSRTIFWNHRFSRVRHDKPVPLR